VELLVELGAAPVVCDVFDAAAAGGGRREARPDVVLHGSPTSRRRVADRAGER